MKHVDVSTEITIEGIPIEVSAIYDPTREETFAVTPRVARENPDHEEGWWELPNYSSDSTIKAGDTLPPGIAIKHDDRIHEAAEEAAGGD